VFRKPPPSQPSPLPTVNVGDDHAVGARTLDAGTVPAGVLQTVVTFRRLEDRLHRYLLVLSASDDDAADLLMDVGTKALRHGRGVDNPEHWLWRVARNTAYRHLRHQRRRAALGRALADDLRTARTVDPAARSEVHNVLAALSKDDREILVLHGCLEFDLIEVAALFGISHEAAWKRWQRARDRFAAALRAVGITSANMDG